MCALSLSPPLLRLDARANRKNSRAMLPLTISGRVHKSRHQFHVLAALVSVYVQCTLIWKYIKCMRILSRILFACYYVISTIFGMKLTAR
jgi:5-enolpyruvylshikimate-3-phosphate synthase